MWKIIRENNFEISENINSEYLCTICRKILIDACFAPCGCRYCKTCIIDYLKGESKTCPRIPEHGKDDLINIDCDIHNDQAVNTRISRLIVTCPNVGCRIKVEINSMETHLEMCENRCVSCPFIDVGCEDNLLKSDKINEHLLSEIYSHAKLLMDWVNISRNETELLKNDIDQLKSENDNLKIKMEGAENIIRDLQINEKKNLSQIEKLSIEMTDLNYKYKFLKEELQDLQDGHRLEKASNSELRERVVKQTKEIDQLKRECIMKKTRLDKDLEEQRKKIDEIDIKMYEISLSNKTTMEKSNEATQSIDQVKKSISILEFGDFVWKIDGWKEKQKQTRNTHVYSNAFFSFKNSYKMCLVVCPNGLATGKGTHLSIFYCVMRGPFDDFLQWPFKHDVEISLINQKTGLVHSSEMFKYSDKYNFILSFRRPISEKNTLFGENKFIQLNEIASSPGVCDNDQIVIKCRVKPLE